MSRSVRKHCFCGITTSDSEKDDKKRWHRAYRRACRNLVNKGFFDMPHYRQYSNPWKMDKDGKIMFDPIDNPKLRRK